jgi:hypothetical protein
LWRRYAPADPACGLKWAVQHAQAVMQEKIAEVEANCHEAEFACWQKKS